MIFQHTVLLFNHYFYVLDLQPKPRNSFTVFEAWGNLRRRLPIIFPDMVPNYTQGEEELG